MTIIEAINLVDALKPNEYSQPEKIQWLSTLDGIIFDEIIKTHEGAEGKEFNGYTEDTQLDTELIVPDPYADVYRFWLESCIHHANEEYAKYNNAKMAYNTAYITFSNYYNRTHMPIGKKIKFF